MTVSTESSPEKFKKEKKNRNRRKNMGKPKWIRANNDTKGNHIKNEQRGEEPK